jgi:hypothetical protein
MNDEKKELVRRILQNGEDAEVAVTALHDYMHDQDSPVKWTWCEWFVQRVHDEMKQEAVHELKSESD